MNDCTSTVSVVCVDVCYKAKRSTMSLQFRNCIAISQFFKNCNAISAFCMQNCTFSCPLLSRPHLAPPKKELTATYSKKSFGQQSLQQEELLIASSKMSFPQESLQQDELQLAYLHQLDLDTSLSFSRFSLFRCSKASRR